MWTKLSPSLRRNESLCNSGTLDNHATLFTIDSKICLWQSRHKRMSHFNRMPCRSSLAKQSNLNVSLQTWTDQIMDKHTPLILFVFSSSLRWTVVFMRLWCIYPSIYALHCTIRQNLVNLAHNDHLLSFCLNHAQGQVLWELFSFHKNHFFSETRFVCPMYDCLQILFIFIIADQSQQKTYTKQYHVMGHMVSSWHHWIYHFLFLEDLMFFFALFDIISAYISLSKRKLQSVIFTINKLF